MKRGQRQKGLTLVEILVVVGILLVLFSVGAPLFNSYHNSHVLTQMTNSLMSALRIAQTRAVSEYQNLACGIHFEEDRFVMFYGESYNPTDPLNETYFLDPKVRISEISVGIGNEIIFVKRAGTATSGHIVLTQGTDGDSYEISVSELGVVNVYKI